MEVVGSKASDLQEQKQALRTLTKSIYDVQKLRISTGNRIAGNFRAKLGQNPGEKLDDKEADKILKRVRLEYARLTDGIVEGRLTTKVIRDVVDKAENGIITNEIEFKLVRFYSDLLKQEEEGFKSLESTLTQFPIYTEFLKQTKGCGPAMSAVIISEFDPYKARHASSFHKYAGLDVAEDGRGRSRRKEHLVAQTYLNKDGEEAEKMGITFNPFLKTKLTGVLGASFLRSKSEYSEIYYNYKHRLQNHPDHQEKKAGHIHNMAIRYAVKIFLINLWTAWRKLEGLPVTLPYHEAKLGLAHGQDLAAVNQ